jgi:hypothetical protein
MGAALTTGFDYECDDSTGGIKQGSMLITQWENITAFAAADPLFPGDITSLTQAALSKFYRYKIKKEIVDFVDTENHDPLQGSFFYENVINAMLFKMSKEKNYELKLLAGKPLIIIVQDLNDIYHIFGLESGCEKTGGTNQAASGKEYGTMNGYTMGFTDKSKLLYTVESSVVAGLVVDGEST